MNALPSQVKEQIEAAKALREQVYGNPEATESAPEQQTEAVSSETVTESPAQETVAAPKTVVTTQTTATPAEDENSQTYANRWRSLQGIHNSALNRISALEQMIASMQSAPAPVQQQPQQVVQSKLITEKDESEYGSDMVDFARRVTREEMSPVMGALAAMQRQLEQLSSLAPTVQQVATQQYASTEEQFFTKLGQAVPDWAQVNDNPQFHDWLLSADSMTGITRQTYLADAQRSFDLGRVVSIFNAWKREAGVQPVAAAAPRPSVDSRLEKQVAPGRANAATAAPQQKAEKTWTRADIAKFYDDKRTGKFRGREAEMAAMEKDIFQAQKQGRVDFAAA